MTPPPPPQIISQKIFIPPKLSIFLKTQKNIDIQNLNPKKWPASTYVWKYQSTPPPPPPPTHTHPGNWHSMPIKFGIGFKFRIPCAGRGFYSFPNFNGDTLEATWVAPRTMNQKRNQRKLGFRLMRGWLEDNNSIVYYWLNNCKVYLTV